MSLNNTNATGAAADAAAEYYNENILQEHGEDVAPETAVILGSIGIAVSAIGFIVLCLWACGTNDGDHFWILCWIPLWIFGLLFIACCLAVAYGRQLDERDDQDYQGQMRITNFEKEDRLERYTSESCSGTGENRHCTTTTHYERYYDAVLTLDWGYGWACPDFNLTDVQCTDAEVVFDSKLICKSSSCGSDAYRDAERRVNNSVFRVYHPDVNYTPYVPGVGPSRDVDWPSLVAFGDCHTCEASLTVSSISTLQALRNASLSLAALAIGVPLLLVGCYGLLWCASDGADWRSERARRRRERRAARRRRPQTTTAHADDVLRWREMRQHAAAAAAFPATAPSTAYTTTGANTAAAVSGVRRRLAGTTFTVLDRHLVESPSAVEAKKKKTKDDPPAGDGEGNLKETVLRLTFWDIAGDKDEKKADDDDDGDDNDSFYSAEEDAQSQRLVSERQDLRLMLSDAQEQEEPEIAIPAQDDGDDDEDDDDEGFPVSSRQPTQENDYESSRRALDRVVLELPVLDQRQVPCVCAICLSTYKTGEQVSWSPTYLSALNRGCPHAFHTECLEHHSRAEAERASQWGRTSRNVSCPLCRQTFCVG